MTPASKSRIRVSSLLAIGFITAALMVFIFGRERTLGRVFYSISRVLRGSTLTVAGRHVVLPPSWWIVQRGSNQVTCARLSNRKESPAVMVISNNRTIPVNDEGIPIAQAELDLSTRTLRLIDPPGVSEFRRGIYVARYRAVDNAATQPELRTIYWLIPQASMLMNCSDVTPSTERHCLELVQVVADVVSSSSKTSQDTDEWH